MKNIWLLVILLLAGCRTTKPVISSQQATQQTVSKEDAPVNFSDQTSWILGYFNPDRLTHYPYSTFYMKGFEEYSPNTDAVNNLLDTGKKDLTIKVVMGTWCPDSRREVPRFMKVLDAWKFPLENVTFIGVDNAKLSPVGEYASLDIVRVPTFIIYKNKVEAGRIIENPTTSLEQDLVNILRGMNNNK
jgi:thiol-disulfide isomerase/thioredoxin